MKSAIRSHKILRCNCFAARWVCAVDCISAENPLYSFGFARHIQFDRKSNGFWSFWNLALDVAHSVTTPMKWWNICISPSESSEEPTRQNIWKFYLKLFICVHILLNVARLIGIWNIWYCSNDHATLNTVFSLSQAIKINSPLFHDSGGKINYWEHWKPLRFENSFTAKAKCENDNQFEQWFIGHF